MMIGPLLFRSTLWLAAGLSALLAGVYFAFSTFVMPALAAVKGEGGVQSMQSINEVILRTPFMWIFWASTLICVALFLFCSVRIGSKTDILVMCAATIFLVGMFGVTVWGNVPLNEMLAQMAPSEAVSTGFWHAYVPRWIAWNHVRTIASAAAGILFAGAATTC